MSAWTQRAPFAAACGLWADGAALMVCEGANGLCRSHDGGLTWSRSFVGRTLLQAATRAADGALYLGDRDGERLQASHDDGKTWDEVKLPLTRYVLAMQATAMHAYALSPQRLWRCAVGKNHWAEEPLLKSQTRARLALTCLAPAADGGLWLGGGRRDLAFLLRSRAGTWSEVETPQRGEIACVAADGEQLWIGGRRLLGSRDGGATWTDHTPGGLGKAKVTITHVACAGDEVWAALSTGALLRSADGGATFAEDWTAERDAPVALDLRGRWLLAARSLWVRE